MISLNLLDQSSGNPFAPSVVYDLDGCQPTTNAVGAIPSGWADGCAAGVTGAWMIRAVVDCAAPVPAHADTSHVLLGTLMAVLGLWFVVPSATRGRLI